MQRKQKGGADDGDRQQRLERRIGDELNDDDFPVGRRDQRAALQGDLDGVGQRHRSLQPI